ncbi:hypothetical protein L207DRAFT_211043 [Hyaloscypha variabilis F]|uniref:Uncharacterized protein n=1 Tax=Hyaloscypha variabilis (strain UAMH 11265 / GT02V1 / F) TaxID=1149755 RepID=A0A2J6S6G1_HYAVF|nr:hypothetical protein L207DRAFT_211043 [Hyaloscypha variabilis F]
MSSFWNTALAGRTQHRRSSSSLDAGPKSPSHLQLSSSSPSRRRSRLLGSEAVCACRVDTEAAAKNSSVSKSHTSTSMSNLVLCYSACGFSADAWPIELVRTTSCSALPLSSRYRVCLVAGVTWPRNKCKGAPSSSVLEDFCNRAVIGMAFYRKARVETDIDARCSSTSD